MFLCLCFLFVFLTGVHKRIGERIIERECKAQETTRRAIFGRGSSTTKKAHPTKNINSPILRTGVDVSVLLIFTLCFFTLISQYYLPIGAGGGRSIDVFARKGAALANTVVLGKNKCLGGNRCRFWHSKQVGA
ncbi:LOW QUALITY PROTEIN: hypothetical protein NC651_013266 [Populus alba x Populus x berolinensis]|nr:LOW QUALITY PROTEIN: hypothetical protein NC651_013266 [Populus alba x Populus x berolinensis]